MTEALSSAKELCELESSLTPWRLYGSIQVMHIAACRSTDEGCDLEALAEELGLDLPCEVTPVEIARLLQIARTVLSKPMPNVLVRFSLPFIVMHEALTKIVHSDNKATEIATEAIRRADHWLKLPAIPYDIKASEVKGDEEAAEEYSMGQIRANWSRLVEEDKEVTE